ARGAGRPLPAPRRSAPGAQRRHARRRRRRLDGARERVGRRLRAAPRAAAALRPRGPRAARPHRAVAVAARLDPADRRGDRAAARPRDPDRCAGGRGTMAGRGAGDGLNRERGGARGGAAGGSVAGSGTGTAAAEVGARRLHLFGIGGSGMASLAAYLLGRGDDVSGCDQKDGALLKLLRAHGARIEIGHDAAHLHGGADSLIHTAAAGADHPELAGAAAREIPTRKYARFLGDETRRRRCVAVAGTHGKTTTTTLLAELLIAGGRDPSAVVGGFPLAWELPGRAGRGEEFVVEACEYDRSFTNFQPHLALVTNVEPDHLDYFGTHENVVRAFEDFLRNVRRDGCAVLHESAARQLDLAVVGGRVLVVGESADA